MRKCKRNILLIFGYLLIWAILFIPFSKPYSSENGYMFSPIFIYKFYKAKKIEAEYYSQKKEIKTEQENEKYSFLDEFVPLDIYENLIELRSALFLYQVLLILFCGGFAYIIFCVVLRKREGGK